MSVLRFAGVGYAIGGRRLLEALRLEVRPGRLLAIVGPNGAGKSTLLRIAAGILRPEGAVFVDDVAIRTLSRRDLARAIAFVPADDTSIEDMTVRDVVAEGRHAHRAGAFDRALAHDVAIDDALERVGLRSLAARPFGELSSGERRRTWIALGLAQEAPILLLDEPTAHLDFRYAQQTLRLMRGLARDGRSVVTVLHDLNEAAQVADDIALVDAGRIVACGPPASVLTRENVARCYAVDVEIVTAADGSIRLFARA